ncbi:MAG: CoA transferase, partial [Chloroflexi bacterium]|nr:CoA transferase [Chloroflexota bacterium]
EGVTILDLTHGITGPYATKLFADYGAEVIKIERPGSGDLSRRLGPFPGDLPHPEKSGMFLDLNTSKKSVTVNLKSATGRSIVTRLAQSADLVVESFRPGVLDRLGLGYADLTAHNPRLSLIHISNFGQTGPYRDFLVDDMVAYAAGGVLSVTGMPDRSPVKLGNYAALLLAGGSCSALAMGALTSTLVQGISQEVDISIMEILAGSMDRGGPNIVSTQYSGALMSQRARNRRVAITPTGVYPCADGFVMISGSANWWGRFCNMIDRPEMATDPHFTQNLFNLELTGEVDALAYEYLFEHGKQEVMEKAQSVGLPVSAINDMEAVFNDPQLRYRNYFVTLDHPYAGPLEYPGPQFRPAESPARMTRAPLLGEHNEEVLCGRLGYTRPDLVTLRERGVI